MQIDYALILSAGLGTRMGQIGKIVPKVLWPIYFKSLLELQINYCQDLGVKKIFINTHFLHDEILAFLVKSSLDKVVTVLHEDPLLDSGGAIHNLAALESVNYQGNLLLVNGDQFLFFEKSFWDKAIERVGKCRAVLFGIPVDKNSAYNETVTSNDRLVEIKKNENKDHDYVTYSGLGLLNLKGLKPTPGISRFFETVANFKSENIELLTPNECEYWDFGTAEVYAENIFKLTNPALRNGQMGKFLKDHYAFEGAEQKFVDKKEQAIDLDFEGEFKPRTIHAKSMFQNI